PTRNGWECRCSDSN
ncbi:matrix protein 2, partial [Influenza A virus (A/northern pintail/Alaska/44191-123/2006(H4N6))]